LNHFGWQFSGTSQQHSVLSQMLRVVSGLVRQIAPIVCLISGICFAGIARGESHLGDRCNGDFGSFIHRDHILDQRYEEARTDIGVVGISPSSDAWVLFGEFAKRFTIVPTAAEDYLRDLRSIAQTGGGNRYELAVALLNLLAWNGIDTDMVSVRSGPKGVDGVVHMLVYVPALDQVFDPTLPLARQHKGSGWALLEGMPRIHQAYPFGRVVKECANDEMAAIRGYYGKRDPGAAKGNAVSPK
jgi:hypothetical protein